MKGQAAAALAGLLLGVVIGRSFLPAGEQGSMPVEQERASSGDSALAATREGAAHAGEEPARADEAVSISETERRPAEPSPSDRLLPGLPVAFIENPAGATAKYEVDEHSDELRQDVRDGRPRVIDFLGYPANYGFIEGTSSRREDGGDGDPLDVLVLGARQPRGARASVVVLGMLRLLDAGERDDKIIARIEPLETGAPFASVHTLDDLRAYYPGLLDIVEQWFVAYDRADPAESDGFVDEHSAAQAIARARR